ncbi:hypothetical protein FQA39_LY13955 [Lamprigera yunnana]|nr:hypothetical protein FQA39_LY13955 [Lamprigera yunnana]
MKTRQKPTTTIREATQKGLKGTGTKEAQSNRKSKGKARKKGNEKPSDARRDTGEPESKTESTIGTPTAQLRHGMETDKQGSTIGTAAVERKGSAEDKTQTKTNHEVLDKLVRHDGDLLGKLGPTDTVIAGIRERYRRGGQGRNPYVDIIYEVQPAIRKALAEKSLSLEWNSAEVEDCLSLSSGATSAGEWGTWPSTPSAGPAPKPDIAAASAEQKQSDTPSAS